MAKEVKVYTGQVWLCDSGGVSRSKGYVRNADTQHHTSDKAQHHSRDVTGQAGQVCTARGVMEEGGGHCCAV